MTPGSQTLILGIILIIVLLLQEFNREGSVQSE